jgi:hypothetical protein
MRSAYCSGVRVELLLRPCPAFAAPFSFVLHLLIETALSLAHEPDGIAGMDRSRPGPGTRSDRRSLPVSPELRHEEGAGESRGHASFRSCPGQTRGDRADRSCCPV